MKRIAWIVLGLLASVCANAASFDCAKAASKVEKLICDNAELSQLDEDLSAAYKAALKDAAHAELIRQSQKQWINKRNTCLDADCVKNFCAAQMALLKLPIVTVPAGNPRAERVGHSATLLPNGKVLIAGGYHGNNYSE